MNSAPTVSIILTSYNHAAYIAAAIDSALNQTFADFELLIVDDGSADSSRDIIRSFDDARIKTFLYEVNRGPADAIREAVQSARGKYVAVHHSDDLWAADKLARQVAYLEANPNCAACFTRVEFIDERGDTFTPAEHDFYREIFEQPNRTRTEWLNYFFRNTNCLCHPSAMVRREVYAEILRADVHGFWQLPDYLMWIRLCFRAEIFILPERLTKFRLRRERQENFSATTFDKQVRAELEYTFVAREFVESFTDDEFFLQVFPEARRFIIGGEFNRRFALAQLLLSRTGIAESAFRLTGLTLLKNLLAEPVDAAQIKKLYGYDDKAFLRDGGTFDAFNLSTRLNVLHAEIFAGDDTEFTLAAAKVIDVDAGGNFYGRIAFELERPAKYLRLDPDNKSVAVKLKRVLINGKSREISTTNAFEVVDGFHRFLTRDPQIVFDVGSLSGRVTIELFGSTEADYLDALNRTITDLRAENKRLAAQVAELRRQMAELLNSNSWRLTEPLRDFRQWLDIGGKDKALAVGRLFYKALPLGDDTKSALKDKFYTRLAPVLKNTQRYRNWERSRILPGAATAVQMYFAQGAENFLREELFDQPGKIAIQAHIFYADLLEEMATYCAKMPYKFDALISIVDADIADKVRAAFEKIPNAEKIIVRVVPNRGRDVAPLVVGFGDVLPAYDFMLHIHSKKSLYTGSEQQNWRQYLFDALIGSAERIRKIFRAFVDDETVGVIYPRPADNVPYSAFTWLSNRAAGMELLRRTGIAPNVTDYFDFPAGTMFWARTRAVQKFFAAGLTIDDFPPEHGQNDGTIAHAFERSILLAALTEDMKYYEFDPTTEAHSVNMGSKNLWQYFGRTAAEVREFVIAPTEIVTFDVFDTLIMRTVARPAHVNEIIGLKVADLLGRDIDFPKLRLAAEARAREVCGRDVTLDDVYKNFSALSGLDAATCEKIRELEISTEVKLCVPRTEVVELFNHARAVGKQVWLISDMYMQTRDLERLLSKCGVAGFDRLLISCETGLRKDTAAIWDDLAAKNFNDPKKLTHIGDNETSDIQLSSDRKFGAYHLMSAFNLFSQVPFGRSLIEQLGGKLSLYAGICLGVALAKKFQSPFRLHDALTRGSNRLVVFDFRELGYWFYGAPLLTFMLWLIQRSRADKIRRLIFLARDGYFLQPLYKFVTELLKLEPLPSDYFLTSRRAVTVASIRNIAQAKELTSLRFEGTTKKFFRERFGLDLGDDTEVIVPDKDVELIHGLMDAHADEILSRAATERAAYEKYIAGLGGDLDGCGVVDMGYSGTIQYYLQQLTGKIFTGYYFATSATNRFGAEASERLRGCFTENDNYATTNSAVYRYQLLFETILTAPDAQLKNFDAAGNAVYGAPEPGQIHIDDISAIHDGIKDFCRDVAEIFGDVLLRVPLDKNFVDAWVRAFVCDTKIVAPELRDIFALDDDYCNTFHGNALDFYLHDL
ncbi:MAG: glycosyltransferase [Quinella sp. 1Q7]|nr:glycosyltransferase [Quinella sp. 1Q7]